MGLNVKRINGIEPHCETKLPNRDCEYLKPIFGACTGCLNKHNPIIKTWLKAIENSKESKS